MFDLPLHPVAVHFPNWAELQFSGLNLGNSPLADDVGEKDDDDDKDRSREDH